MKNDESKMTADEKNSSFIIYHSSLRKRQIRISAGQTAVFAYPSGFSGGKSTAKV
jgi:hypothetical protein